jgi:hypothetical protein
MEWATLPDTHRRTAMWIVESNWLQVLEGNVDTGCHPEAAAEEPVLSGAKESACRSVHARGSFASSG